MKKRMTFAFILMTSIFFSMNAQEKEMTMNASVSIVTKSYSVTVEDNDAAKVFFGRLPLSLTMNEWAGNSEYYARLSEKINTDGIKSPSTFETGDIAIYNNTSMVVFYADTKNTAGYAKIGHITEAEGVKDALKAAKGKVIFTHMSEK